MDVTAVGLFSNTEGAIKTISPLNFKEQIFFYALFLKKWAIDYLVHWTAVVPTNELSDSCIKEKILMKNLLHNFFNNSIIVHRCK